MSQIVNHLKSFWQSRLLTEYPHLDSTQRDSIQKWLLGENVERLENLSPQELAAVSHALNCRYQILRKYYLGVSPVQAYCHLFDSLGKIFLTNPQIRRWSHYKYEHKKIILKILQQMVEDILKSDSYVKEQKKWIAKCTRDISLRNAFLLTIIQEYCSFSCSNPPLFLNMVFNFINHPRPLNHLESEFFCLILKVMSTNKFEIFFPRQVRISGLCKDEKQVKAS